MEQLQRIAVIGSCGAGKSTFTKELGNLLGIDVIHLDKHYWKPGWIRTPSAEWEAKQKKLVGRKQWIIDGNYRSSFHIRLPVADTIIFFDFPKWLCLWRAMKRRLQYHNKSRDDLGGVNKERVTWRYLHWILTYPRKETLQRTSEYKKDKNVVIFKRPADVQKFIDKVMAGDRTLVPME